VTDSGTVESLVAAIHSGDVAQLRLLVENNPGLASAELGGRHGTRTPLHVASDWPGFFPNGGEVVNLLLQAGADPNARSPEKGSESPLHWAASSDDAAVATALIDGGADIELEGGSIGSPLDNAIGYACWDVARLLVSRGAKVEKLWHAAALGMQDRLELLLEQPATNVEISQAFWHACAAGQRRTAEHLLGRGAEINWVPDYADGAPLDAASGNGTQRSNLVAWLREKGAQSTKDSAQP
jgi:uncharacterized protein